MRIFKDTAGRSWSLAINVDAIKRVRSMANVDLLDVTCVDRLTGDPVLLCDVLYALLKSDADAAKVTDIDFGRAMGGDTLDAATTAFLEELADFFPRPRRQVLSLALEKARAVEAKVTELATKRLQSPELDAQIEAALEKAFLPSSTNSPASPGLTPAP